MVFFHGTVVLKLPLCGFCQSQGAEVMKVLAEQAEHRKEVVQKAINETCNFSSLTQEKINQKMEATKESRNAQMAALTEKFKARVSSIWRQST